MFRRAAVALAAVSVVAAVVPALAGPKGGDAAELQATIRWGSNGIPQIIGKDFGDIGYGYGYAFAKSNICVMADSYVTVNGQRSKYFGPDGSYVFQGNGLTVNNLNSDFFFQQIKDDKRIERLLSQPAPDGPRPEVKEGVRGYVAGWNAYLRSVGGSRGISDPSCRGASWVRAITEMDAYRRFYQLALLASSGVALDGIGAAQPPTPSAPVPGAAATAAAVAPTVDTALVGELSERWKALAIGSNAVALGKDATANGRGMLLGNPHFPWQGTERFYQAHLTIPGKLDVQGGSLFGVPIVLIGSTARMAWSHTVSTAFRFTPFQLTLVPGSPTTYLYDGKPTPMTARTVSVDVRQDDGSIAKQQRTLYSTRQGPVLTSILGLPIFPWTPTTAFAMGDANAANFRYVNHFFETNLAQSSREMLEVLKRNQGIPWVNTVVSDDKGEALYADISVTPNVPDSKAAECNSPVGVATFQALRLPVLDGSRSACEWDVDPDARQKGIFGPSNMPYLFRSDYVTNSNDSYWLSNPKAPLTGFARIIGDESTARTLRTRSGLVMVEERLAGKDGRPGRKFTRQQLQDLVFNNRQQAGELTRDDVVAMCRSFPGGVAPSSTGAPVALGDACDVLAAWDKRDDLDSEGAILFRRFWTRADDAAAGLWRVPFDPADPVNTPRGLNTEHPQVRVALGDAVRDLQNAGIPLDAGLRGWQYEQRGTERVPIHGGPGTLGVFNALNVGWNATKGYPDVAHGSSYVQVVSFDGDGCPDARSILTYSQSTDPTSPYYADQTRMYAEKKWVTMRFCEADVLADPKLRVETLREPKRAGR